ncbi:hypothetical protein C8R41DRAFT_839856 [Lentinula lateritia]|uniref:Uncharacterized protein n=1 Tax=Lentinula lateritia TaxID=40482 RepID=A0ABQ8VAK6_9AGAR|nr:hypothetical protein C8R41DRAFT_839856 [Lentinula lateritia]
MGSGDPELDNAPVAPMLNAKTDGLISRVFSLEYRICAAKPFLPVKSFPAHFLNTVAGYQYLLEDLPQNIGVSGISSTPGHLAVAFPLYLLQAQQGLTRIISAEGKSWISPV